MKDVSLILLILWTVMFGGAAMVKLQRHKGNLVSGVENLCWASEYLYEEPFKYSDPKWRLIP